MQLNIGRWPAHPAPVLMLVSGEWGIYDWNTYYDPDHRLQQYCQVLRDSTA